MVVYIQCFCNTYLDTYLVEWQSDRDWVEKKETFQMATDTMSGPVVKSWECGSSSAAFQGVLAGSTRCIYTSEAQLPEDNVWLRYG